MGSKPQRVISLCSDLSVPDLEPPVSLTFGELEVSNVVLVFHLLCVHFHFDLSSHKCFN